ncbi:2-hydroxychromene-2-carboxylate isomerase [Planktotalea sp.]|uniref:2-hydroxychromene-2-carboxylate isomerase n=1 Tax=Planktotalea sp. TaxID=2029877 RepID=UPI003D6C2B79
MLTFWFEFASTYSCLSALRIEALAQKSGIKVRWRPFLLGPIFKAQGMETSPFNLYPLKGSYMWRDMERQFAQMGLPSLTVPEAFPQHGLLAARIATLGMREEWGKDFTRDVYRAQFMNGKNIGDSTTLAAVLTGLKLNPTAIIESARSDASIKAELRLATEQAQALGIFGAPSFTASDGELFWGNDRLDAAIAWQIRINAKQS